MKEKTQHILCFALTFFNVCFAVTVSIYIFMLTTQVANLQKELVSLRQIKVGKEEFIDESKTKKDEIPDSLKDERRRSVLDASGLIHDLILSQEHILESHCANNTKLCMRGPKGETGEKGDKGDTSSINTFTSKCECLRKPTILNNTTTSISAARGQDIDLFCQITGNPRSQITWLRDGVRTSNSRDVLHLSNLQSSSNYTCLAQNILGTDSMTFNVQVA